MATNVRVDELNYDSYDTGRYDDEIVRVIPGYEELHKFIERIVQRDFTAGENIIVLELGVGTGLTAERILRIIPDAKYRAVDFSEQMLSGARRRLTQYKVRFIQGDYSKILLPQDNDLVVSIIGIHHQKTDEDKKSLFQRIYDSLNEKGAFLFGDLVTYRNPEEATLNKEEHYRHLKQHAPDEQSLQEWEHHHKQLNRLAPLEDQVEWLREAGFRIVEVVYRKFNTALIYAKK